VAKKIPSGGAEAPSFVIFLKIGYDRSVAGFFSCVLVSVEQKTAVFSGGAPPRRIFSPSAEPLVKI